MSPNGTVSTTDALNLVDALDFKLNKTDVVNLLEEWVNIHWFKV